MTAAQIPASEHRLRFGPRFRVRAVDLGARCDTFLVVAVAAVLGNRLFLIITGYPQLGDGTLHVSHAIWGALMLATAVIFSISYLGPFTRKVVAVLGGAGFGWFIDELGKFITRKVNYFYEPTIALIYMTFIAMYLVFRALRRRQYTADEGLLNALEAVKSAALGQLDEPARREAVAMLDATNTETDEFAGEVRSLLTNAPALPARQPSRFAQWDHALRAWYLQVTEHRWFVVAIDGFFMFLALGAVLTVISLVLEGPGVVGFDETASLISALVANTCLLIGVVLLRRHQKLRAYQWFDRGLLISIFVTQVFVFADEQLGGMAGLVVILIVWVLLRGAMHAERERAGVDVAEPSRA